MTFIDDGNPDALESNPEMINLLKMCLFTDSVKEVLKFQSEPFPFQVVPEIRQFFIQAPISSSEEEKHSLSLYLEPRGGKERPKDAPPLLRTLSNYFDQKLNIVSHEIDPNVIGNSSISSSSAVRKTSSFGSLKRKKSI